MSLALSARRILTNLRCEFPPSSFRNNRFSPPTVALSHLPRYRSSRAHKKKAIIMSAEITSTPAIGTLSTPPMPNQTIQHNGKEYTTVKEGLAYILTPVDQESQQRKGGGSGALVNEARPSVFYNPIQQFNRDLSVLAIRAYAEHAVATKQIRHEGKVKRRMEAKSRKGNGKGVKRKREGEEKEGGNKKADTGDKSGTEEVNGAETKVEQIELGAQEVAKSPEWKPSFTILDALSASGLRALRYAKEIPYVTRVVGNDLSGNAIESMKMNIQHNGVGDIVQPNHSDACSAMYSVLNPMKPNKDGTFFGRYDVVDLDPYGTAAPFLDAAVQSVNDGGLLCVTCTDAGVFAAVGYPEKTFSLYGGVCTKGPQSHEAGLRLILHALAMAGAKYGLSIEPLLSLSIDFYARVFVRVHKSPSAVKFQAGKTMIVYNCDSGCGSWKIQPLAMNRLRKSNKGTEYYHHALAQGPMASPTCDHCGLKTHLAGPMWAGPLHNPHFIQRILDFLPGADRETYPTVDRIEGMLVTALEEDLDLGSETREPTPDPESKTPPSTSQDRTTSTDPSTYLIPRVDPAKLEPYPFFFMPSFISKVVHTQTMPEDTLRGALRHLGYRSTRSHAKPNSVRTDAPWEVVWEIMREWVRQKAPVRAARIKPGTAGEGILKKGAPAAGDEGVKALKKDILEAVEAGRGLADLRTRIEAALYRSGASRPESSAAKTCEFTPMETEGTTAETKPASECVPIAPSKLNVVFDEAMGQTAMAAHRKKRLVRYQVNPRPNWGPLSRAPIRNPKSTYGGQTWF